jgi:hypothetical protein
MSGGWVSTSSRGLWGGHALLLSAAGNRGPKQHSRGGGRWRDGAGDGTRPLSEHEQQQQQQQQQHQHQHQQQQQAERRRKDDAAADERVQAKMQALEQWAQQFEASVRSRIGEKEAQLQQLHSQHAPLATPLPPPYKGNLGAATVTEAVASPLKPVEATPHPAAGAHNPAMQRATERVLALQQLTAGGVGGGGTLGSHRATLSTTRPCSAPPSVCWRCSSSLQGAWVGEVR